jgi:hypothetical protein
MSETTPSGSPWGQSVPVPTWLGLVLLIALGPADTLAARLVPAETEIELARRVEELASRVEELSRQMDEMRDDDRDLAGVLQEVLERLEQ